MKTRKSQKLLLLISLLAMVAIITQAQSDNERSRSLKFRSNTSVRTETQRRAEAKASEKAAAEEAQEEAQTAEFFDDRDRGGEDVVVGTFEATFTSAETPASFPPLPALFTFQQGGTFIETDGGGLAATPPPDPTFGSPGHGVWKRIGNRLYAVKFVILVVKQDGTLDLKGEINLLIRLSRNGKSFEGRGTFDFTDADGNPIEGGSGPEKVSGHRIEID